MWKVKSARHMLRSLHLIVIPWLTTGGPGKRGGWEENGTCEPRASEEVTGYPWIWRLTHRIYQAPLGEPGFELACQRMFEFW